MPLPNGVKNPFSDKFLEMWELWKAYMQESHNFKYKGLISEQMALYRLVELSGGEEEKAIRIIRQSISREWKDFFELRQPSQNGKSKKGTSANESEQSGSLRERVSAAFNKRYGSGEDTGDNSHLKAV